ncbi:hypothetical protein [Flavobacterium phycosphaerae]|uniref:hypothetical protein n=1 Tax=Flavobacterium phycosphaerae TaxID=2697515 RepID=UPI001F477332|nr:hypothetical protein [Flavobacterium phycosphaerae]
MEEQTAQNNSTPQRERLFRAIIVTRNNSMARSKGRELYWPGFKIYEIDYPVVYKLIAYFLRDEQACNQFGVNLSKGILLSGPVGCGKTALMNLMKFITKQT